MTRFKGGVAITGVGSSRVGRTAMPAPADLLVDATLAALNHAGLDRSDIDGISTYPGRENMVPGMSPLGIVEARGVLGLKTEWHSSVPEGPAQIGALMVAAMAVASGQARHVLVFRCLTEASSQVGTRSGINQGNGRTISGPLSWLLPSGAVSAVNWTAMIANRYMHQFGLTREQLGHQAVLQRQNAHLNPKAVLRDKPLSIDDYLQARMISDPLCLFDCDIPVDGAVAVIVSSIDAARDLRNAPLRIEAMGAGMYERETWDQRPDLTTMAANDAAASLWKRTDLRPHDVDVAGLYDGFSIFVLIWLEAHGFCGRGEAGSFIADGNTARDGIIPTNTGGGQLSAGRLHGFGHVEEVCLQLWGEGGDRQVKDAEVGLIGVGGGPFAGTMLLTRG